MKLVCLNGKGKCFLNVYEASDPKEKDDKKIYCIILSFYLDNLNKKPIFAGNNLNNLFALKANTYKKTYKGNLKKIPFIVMVHWLP